MEFVLLDREHEPDARLLNEMSAVIKESWRKILVNMGVYTEDYERDSTIWGPQVITAELDKGNRWLLGRENGLVVAAVIVDAISQWGEEGFQLRQLVVHPNRQGDGRGAALLAHVAGMGMREGKTFILLFTSSLLVSLVNYYKRLGFQEYKREDVNRYGLEYERVFLRHHLNSGGVTSGTAGCPSDASHS